MSDLGFRAWDFGFEMYARACSYTRLQYLDLVLGLRPPGIT